MSSEEQPPVAGNYPRPEARPKFCPQCGATLGPADRFCSGCGRRLGAPPGSSPGQIGGTDGFAIASIVCAVAALFAAPILGSILAIYFGKRAQENIRQNPALQGEGLAQAGIFIGWASMILGVFFIMIGLSVLSSWR